MKWKDKLVNDLIRTLAQSKDCEDLLADITSNQVSIHLAIFTEPYLSYLLSGEKTIESRLSINRLAPFGKVSKNDIVIIKKSGGDIYGVFRVFDVKYFSNLNLKIIEKIDDEYGTKIMWNLDPSFLLDKVDAKFLTLIEIFGLRKLIPFESSKKDRGSWVVVVNGFKNTLFQTSGL